MSLFSSQFERARGYSDAYAGPSDDPSWWTPGAAAAAVVAGAGLLAVTAAAMAADDGHGHVDTWGAGWDTGWDTTSTVAHEPTADTGSDWMHHGDYTDASVGGDGDFFYFIDGDSSLTVD